MKKLMVVLLISLSINVQAEETTVIIAPSGAYTFQQSMGVEQIDSTPKPLRPRTQSSELTRSQYDEMRRKEEQKHHIQTHISWPITW